MTDFRDSWPMTDSAPPGAVSAFVGLPDVDPPVPAGAYGHGLLFVFDSEWSTRTLQSWQWALKPTHRVLMGTGFGDLFLWDNDEGVSYLEVQRGALEPIGANVRWFLDDFLRTPRIVEEVLRKSRLEELISRHGPLPYQSIFILKPWPMLGGEDKIENYTRGDCHVYLDLVGQSLATSKQA